MGVLGLLAFFTLCPVACAQSVEKNPNKCALINLAHFYLRCANLHIALGREQKRLLEKKLAPEMKAALEATSKPTEELIADYLGVAMTAYNLAGRKLDNGAMDAREKLDRPEVEAAFAEAMERVRQQNTGKRNSPKPNILELCSLKELGAEAKDNKKINERLERFKGEAQRMAQAGKSCIK